MSKHNTEKENECDCGCHEGSSSENCTCGDDCDCGCHGDSSSENCTCGDDHDCGCQHDHGDKSQEEQDAYNMYEKAFRQLEDALIKADKEIQKEKQRADENEHIARCFRQDLERFKERNKNAEAQTQLKVNKDVALKIIPVLDNFDQALTKVTDEPTKKGFLMIYSKLTSVLGELGVSEIETENAEFNPEFHDCINKRQPENKKQSNRIASVYQKGYKFNDEDGKVIRHAVVEIYE